LRLVLDKNTALSGLLWQGKPGQLLDAALEERLRLFSSLPLLAELEGVLKRPKLADQLRRRGLTPETLSSGYAAMVQLVVPAKIPLTIDRDPDDDMVLATAIAGEVDLIVSGDRDLLDLGRFRDIAIVTAADAVQHCREDSDRDQQA
jgi:uncharacterized protein